MCLNWLVNVQDNVSIFKFWRAWLSLLIIFFFRKSYTILHCQWHTIEDVYNINLWNFFDTMLNLHRKKINCNTGLILIFLNISWRNTFSWKSEFKFKQCCIVNMSNMNWVIIFDQFNDNFFCKFTNEIVDI